MNFNERKIAIHHHNNIVKEVNYNYIMNYIINYLENIGKKEIMDFIFDNDSKYFTKKFIGTLPNRNIEFQKDTENTSYIYYQNCFVKITPNNLFIKSYSQLKNVVWEKSIINRNFNINKKESVFSQFISNVCKGNVNKINTMQSAIGYLLHRYNDSSYAKAIIFCDENISEGAEGRNGKGIVSRAISKIRNTVVIDGKAFSFNKNFPYQQINYDTQIINFNDIKKDFVFSNLFSCITEGITVEKKNQHPFTIPFEDAPKILISTNFTVKGEDGSSKDRKFEVEFSDYYNEDYKPEQDFEDEFFSKWNQEEWNAFDMYMIKCLQYYLKYGLVNYDSKTLRKKKLLTQTSKEFAYYIKLIDKSIEHNLTELYNDFMNEYKKSKDEIKQNKFTIWIKIFCQLYSYRPPKIRYSNGKTFIRFVKKVKK